MVIAPATGFVFQEACMYTVFCLAGLDAPFVMARTQLAAEFD